MTFASGAIPLSVGGAGAGLGAHMEESIESIDGNPVPFSLVNQAPADTVTELVYALPASTTFDGFAVPNVTETPSRFTTFTRGVEVYGSSTSAEAGYELLARATLATHEKPNQQTELEVVKSPAVRWVKLRLSGGIKVESERSTFQFSELVAHGKQESPPLAGAFHGLWGAGLRGLELKQTGAVVAGCYDGVAPLSGTVTGNILKARGVEPRTKVVSLFVLTVMPDGSIRGVRSTNGAPFRLVDLTAHGDAAPSCPSLAAPTVGCGSTLHGINFALDSAEIRPDSGVLLGQLFDSLKRGKSAKVVIEGHTSSEGAEQYNLDLSRRRAEAVVAELVRRGIAAGRISAVGRGESSPIASNADEAGRSLNRRVEVRCE
jgi:OmpA-OmpF porin, OOP family